MSGDLFTLGGGTPRITLMSGMGGGGNIPTLKTAVFMGRGFLTVSGVHGLEAASASKQSAQQTNKKPKK